MVYLTPLPWRSVCTVYSEYRRIKVDSSFSQGKMMIKICFVLFVFGLCVKSEQLCAHTKEIDCYCDRLDSETLGVRCKTSIPAAHLPDFPLNIYIKTAFLSLQGNFAYINISTLLNQWYNLELLNIRQTNIKCNTNNIKSQVEIMCFQSSTTTHIDGSPNPKTTTHVTRLPIIETTTHVDGSPITTSVTKTITHIGRLPMTTSVTKTTITAGVTKTTTSVTKTTPYIIGLLTHPTSESPISWIETN
jgi:hypothetical protein